MGKGTRATFRFREHFDSDTGTRVTRLTPKGSIGLRNYFYQKAFTTDGRSLILGSDFGGPVAFWWLDLASGAALQLTEGTGENIQGAYLSTDDRSLFFTRNQKSHVRLDLETLNEETVYEVPAGWHGYGTWSPNSECTRLAALLMKSEDRVTGDGWDRFTRQFEARPLQRLLDVDLGTGEARTVLEDRRYLGHPGFRPNDTMMSFCHEGPHDRVESRIWFVDSDGNNLRKAKQQAQGESCMHEFWVPDGSRMVYVSYTKGESHRSIWSVDPVSLVNHRLMNMPPCSHLMSNHDGSLLVGDGAGQLGDVDDKSGYAFEPDPFLYLFDTRTRTHRRLCGHHTSWKVYDGNTQASHPHPSFSPDGTKVLFASDFEGELAVYLADLE